MNNLCLFYGFFHILQVDFGFRKYFWPFPVLVMFRSFVCFEFCIYRVLLPGFIVCCMFLVFHVFVCSAVLFKMPGGGGVGIRGVGRGMITFFLIIGFHQDCKPET